MLSRIGALFTLAGVVLSCIAPVVTEIRSPGFVAILLVLQIAATLKGFHGALPSRGRESDLLAWSVLAIAAFIVGSRAAGPFLMVPALLTATGTLAGLSHEHRSRWFILAALLVSFWTIVALEVLGIVPATIEFEGGRMIIQSDIVRFEPGPTLALAVFAATSTISIAWIGAYLLRQQADQLELGRAMLSWQLGQLVAKDDEADAEDDDGTRWVARG